MEEEAVHEAAQDAMRLPEQAAEVVVLQAMMLPGAEVERSSLAVLAVCLG